MKNVIYSIFYLSLLIIINYESSKFFNLSFAEMAFTIGLISNVLIGFFSSEGGITSQMLDLKMGDMKSCV